MIGFEPGFEARVVADDVTFTLPEYLLQAALDASYAAKDHTHTADQITGLEGSLGSYLTKTDATATYEPLITNSITYSDDIDNDQSRFFWLNLSGERFRASWAGIRNRLKSYFDTVYAKVTHSHSIAEVSGLQGQLDSKLGTGSNSANGDWYANWLISRIGRVGLRNNGETSLWFHDAAGTEKAVIWINEKGGNLHFRVNGQTSYLAPSGQFWASTDLVARSVVYAGSGASRLETNGNVVGNIWSNWGSSDAYTAVHNRVEDRAYWRTRDYLLAEHIPVGGYVFAQCLDNIGAGGTTNGTRLRWAAANGGGSAGGNAVNYGTWQCCGFAGVGGGANNQPAATTLWKRIG